jgi:hypothetical protein
MKSEHRHDLKTNELGRLVEQLRPALERYGNQILVGICIAVLVFAASAYFAFRTSPSARGWAELLFASTAEDFANVADDFAASDVAIWARLQEAESYYQTGVLKMFSDREAGDADLKEARAAFEMLLESPKTPSEARERAQYGLARTLEATSGSNTDDAVHAYEQLLDEFPETVMKQTAEQRIAVLRTKQEAGFYAWFQEQNPVPQDRKGPQDGKFDLGGQFPHGGLPGGGGITLPLIPRELQLPADQTEPVGNEAGSDASDANSGESSPAEEKAGGTSEESSSAQDDAVPADSSESADSK